MKRQPVAYSILIIFLTLAVTVPAGILYTNHVQRVAAAEQERLRRESDQRWCALLVTMDDAYADANPTTEVGRRIAALMHKLRTDFGC